MLAHSNAHVNSLHPSSQSHHAFGHGLGSSNSNSNSSNNGNNNSNSYSYAQQALSQQRGGAGGGGAASADKRHAFNHTGASKKDASSNSAVEPTNTSTTSPTANGKGKHASRGIVEGGGSSHTAAAAATSLADSSDEDASMGSNRVRTPKVFETACIAAVRDAVSVIADQHARNVISKFDGMVKNSLVSSMSSL